MFIRYFKNQYGYHVETLVNFCCDEMKANYDFSHRKSWCIALGHKSGKVRIYGAYDYQKDEYKHMDLKYCNFCGEKVELQEVKALL